ncbi:hypothetical protein FF1_043469 [Malus domestica]
MAAPSLFLAFTELKVIFSNRDTEAFEVIAGRNHAIAQKLKTWCGLHCSSLFSKKVFGSPVAGKVFRASPYDTSSAILCLCVQPLGLGCIRQHVTLLEPFEIERDVLMNDDDDIVDDNWAMMQLDALKKRHPKRKKMMMICLVMFHSLALFVFARCFSGLRVCNPEGAMRLLF